MQLTALVREPLPSFVRAVSTHFAKHTLNYERALIEHRAYTRALKAAGARLVFLAGSDSLPDGPFVEDTAVIFPDHALICPMKEASRQAETASVAEALRPLRRIDTLPPPATLDGGDVLDTDDTLFVGLSRRSNSEAARILAQHANKPVIPVAVRGGLHLKTSATYLGGGTIVLYPAQVDAPGFQGLDRIVVTEKERYAANCLAIGETVLMPAGFPRVAGEIKQRGFQVVELPMGEFEKADGGVTCLSLRVPG
jgi:dimethylargininase